MRKQKPYTHRNLFDNINLIMSVHKLTSISIWCPKKISRKLSLMKTFIECLKVTTNKPIYIISNRDRKDFKDLRQDVKVTNNAPANTLVITIGVHSVRELETCNLHEQWFVIDIQKNKYKKKGFGVISYLWEGEEYNDWLEKQLREYLEEDTHITFEELFKSCPYLPIPD